jgi:hypothetical protein
VVVKVGLSAAYESPVLLLRVVVIIGFHSSRLGSSDAVSPRRVLAGFGHDKALGVLEIAVDALDGCVHAVFLFG